MHLQSCTNICMRTHTQPDTLCWLQVQTAHGQPGKPSPLTTKPSPLTTKELVTRETARVGSAVILNPGCSRDDERYRLMCDLSTAKRRAERMESKLRKIRELVEKAEKEEAVTLQVRPGMNLGKLGQIFSSINFASAIYLACLPLLTTFFFCSGCLF